MQLRTWLPLPSYADSAACLDWKRLYRQLADATYILSGSNSHAGLLWRGYEAALSCYYDAMLTEWISRGYATKREFRRVACDDFPVFPDALHASHRANLLRKSPEFYCKNGWTDVPSDYLCWTDVSGKWFWQRQGYPQKVYLCNQLDRN